MRKGLTLLAILLVGLAVPRAEAATIVFGTDPISIPGLTTFATTGSMMDGLAVTAAFADGWEETQVWADTVAGSGGVTGDRWGLSVTGDTFSASWNFVNTRDSRIVSLYLNGLSALTVFDVASVDTVPSGGQTSGSQAGTTWTCALGDCADPLINVTYNWRVSIGGAAAQGDLWQTVRVDFAGVGPDRNFSFVQDTDNDLRLVDPVNPVPEPGTLALLGAGLAAARFSRRRR